MEGETHNVVVSHKEKEEKGGSKWRLVKNEIKRITTDGNVLST